MKKITSLFTFTRVGSNGSVRVVACINKDTFINAEWLAKGAKLSIDNLDLLVGSSIDVTYFAIDEVLADASGEGADLVEAKLCTKANTIVKEFSIEPSMALTCARIMLKAA